MNLLAYPGGDLVTKGLADLRSGRESAEAMLVLVGRPRLRALGFDVPDTAIEAPEHRLYGLLAAIDPDSAHSRYNALLSRLVSFERAFACGG